MKKSVLMILLVVIVTLSSFAANTWKIGVVGPFQQETGEWIKQAVEMAAEEINLDGGIAGKQIELIFQDSEAKAEKMITAIQKLTTRERVDFIIGGMSSGAVLGAMDRWARYKTIWLGTGAASAEVTDKVGEDYDKYKYYFRIGTLDSISQGTATGDFITNYLKPKYGITKAAIVAVDLVYSKGIAEEAARVCEENGIEVVYRDYFPMGTTDFSATFKKAVDAGAQVIINSIVTDDGIAFVKQWYDLKVKAAIVGPVGPALKPEFYDQTGGKCIFETSAYPNGGPAPLTSNTMQFVEDHVAKYGNNPGFISYPAYNALYVLKEASKNVKDINNKDEWIKAIEKVEFKLGGDKGVAPVVFDENHSLKYGGDAARGIIFQWQGKDKWEAVYPEEYATGEWMVPEWMDWKVQEVNGISEDTVKIGSFQALSGPVAPIGVSMRKGMDAYFNWVNENGGINGRKIDLLVADDQFNPSKTVVEVKRMVEQDKVFSMVGGLGTPGCLAVMDYLNNSKVPFVYQGSGSSLLAVPPKEYVFSVQPNYYSTEGPIAAKYLTEIVGAKKIGIVYRADDAGKEALAGMKKWLEENGHKGKLVAELPINPTATAFDNEIIELMTAEVDAVYMLTFIPQTPNFLKQSKDYGYEPLFLGSYANADVTLIALAQDAAEGFESLAWVDIGNTEDPNVQKYFEIYDSSFPGEIPNAYAAAGFIAAEVFTEGLKRAGKNPTVDSLVTALEGMKDWRGMITPSITYSNFSSESETCRVGVREMYILKVKDGQMLKHQDWVNLK